MIGTVDQQAELRIPRIMRGSPGGGTLTAAVDEVLARMVRLQASRVDGCQIDLLFPSHDLGDRLFQQLRDIGRAKQTASRFLKRCEMRHRRKFYRLTPLRRVLQMLNQSAIVGLQKRSEHQASKERRLRELPGTATMTVSRQHRLGNLPRAYQHLPW